MAANMFESQQANLSTDIVGNISQPSDLDISGLIPNSTSFGRSGENVIFGGSGSSLTGTNGVDVFVITNAGANIYGFEVGKDKVGIISDEP